MLGVQGDNTTTPTINTVTAQLIAGIAVENMKSGDLHNVSTQLLAGPSVNVFQQQIESMYQDQKVSWEFMMKE